MDGNEKSFIPGSKVGPSPSPKKLKEFIDRGGYAFLESIGDGKTSEEKQLNGWGKHGVFSRLSDKTKISRTTLYRIAAWFPTIESTGKPKGMWIKEENCTRLKVACSELEEVEKLLLTVKEYFGRCLCVDLMKLRMRQEILGESTESFQLALKQQVETGEKEETTMETTLNEALRKLQLALRDLQSIIHYT
jgi:hypothetical protein